MSRKMMFLFMYMHIHSYGMSLVKVDIVDNWIYNSFKCIANQCIFSKCNYM